MYLKKKNTKLTIRGRRRGSLKFKINNLDYNVEKVQIEVDGGYESKNKIHLIEAKLGFTDNINIRQLLYPYLYWKNETKNKKEILNYIFLYYDGLFRFIPYIYNNKGIGFLNQDDEKVFRFK